MIRRLFIPDLDPDFLSIADSGSRGQKGTGFRIRIRNTASGHGLINYKDTKP
jgi:hypothetical protein